MMGIDEFNVSTEALKEEEVHGEIIKSEPLPKRKRGKFRYTGKSFICHLPFPPVEGDQISKGLIKGPNRTQTSLQSKALRSHDCH